MSLRFIYGRAGSGKTHFCLSEIERIVSGSDGRALLLVPEDFSFQAEKDLLDAVGDKGLLQARVLSFKRMAYSVFSEVGGLTRRHMNGAGKCMLVYRIMDKCKGELKVFKRAVKMRGFVDTMSDTITELKEYGISPEDLMGASLVIDDDGLKDKACDILRIYSAFESALHQNYIDSDDDLILLSQSLDRSRMFDGAEVFVDGFSLLTPQQLRVIEGVARKAKRVNVTLCMDAAGSGKPDAGAQLFSPSLDIENRLLKMAAANNLALEEPVFLNRESQGRFKNNVEIRHLERNIFSFPYRVYGKETGYIRLFTAVNRYSEVENTARGIIRLCRDEGFRFSDIAVIAGGVGEYEKLVGAIFPEYGIPYFLNRKRDISGNPLIVLVLSSLEIISRRWPYESVFRYLKTGLLNFNEDEIDELENYVLLSGIRGDRWTNGSDWKYWPQPIDDDAKTALARINDIRNRVSAPLLEFESRAAGGGKGRNLCTFLFDFLSGLKVEERMESLIDQFKAEGDMDLAEEYGKVWNMLIGTLDQLVEVLGDEDMTLDQFSKVLSIGFDECSIGLIPPSIDQVMFGSVERIKSHTVKALFIMGMNDRVFPAPLGDEGILSDSDREKLKRLGLELAPGTRDLAFEEQFLVYTAFTRTSKYLYISFPIADSEGASLRPSNLIARIRKIFPKLSENSNISQSGSDQENLELVSVPTPTFNHLVCEMRRRDDGEEVNPLWMDVYEWYMEHGKWRDRCQIARSGLSYHNDAAGISPEKVRNLYGGDLSFSISRLEKYAECPFAYFAQYALRAKERKVYELSPPDIGSFIHMVLDSFSSRLDENGIGWRDLDKEWCENTVSEIVDSTVDEMSGSILSSSARYRYLKERLKRIILRAVWLISRQIKNGGFEPKGHEITFANGGDYPPISIKLPSGERISLIGRIDRMDTMEDEMGVYVRIIDYKTGMKDFNLSDVYNGLELQLLVYLDAILEYARKNTAKPVFPGGILYVRIDDPIIKSDRDMDSAQIEKEMMKQLRMKGLLLADVNVIRNMDRNIDGYSLIVPAMVKSDGTLGSPTSAASAGEFDELRKHVKNRVIELCEEMLKGDISISPYKNKNDIPCRYCPYSSICRFDVSIRGNSYRMIPDRSRDQIWKALKEENTEGEA